MFNINEYIKPYEFDFVNIETNIENNKKYISNVTSDMYYSGRPRNCYWTFHFIQEISKYINFDDIEVILDIGSRDCYQSEEFKMWFPNSKVYAFEANPEAYNTCLSVAQNYKDINVIGKGVGEKNCQLEFYVSDLNPGASSLLEVEEKNLGWKAARSYMVDIVRIDDWCKQNEINSVDILWVDVQGYETEVFSGCGEILTNVKAIQTEISFGETDYKNGSEFHKLNSFFEKMNFELIKVLTYPDWNGSVGEVDAIYVNKKFKI